MTMLPTAASALLVAMALAAPASAEIYRWTGADGRVHYGERHAASAAQVEYRPDLASAAEASSSPPAGEPADAVSVRGRARLAALERAQESIVEAGRALERALERQQRGIEPLPGERLGIAGGGSRLAPAYFDRQARLEKDVRLARAQLDAAYAAKNELR